MIGATCPGGGMVYAADLKSVARKGVRVRLPPRAPRKSRIFNMWFFCCGSRGAAIWVITAFEMRVL